MDPKLQDAKQAAANLFEKLKALEQKVAADASQEGQRLLAEAKAEAERVKELIHNL